MSGAKVNRVHDLFDGRLIMSRVSLRKHVTRAMGIVVAMGVILPSSNALAQNGVADIKAAFDAAMAKPLAERVPQLTSLEQRIDQSLFDGALQGKARTTGLYQKYHVQMQLAKWVEARETYAAYIRSIKDNDGAIQARSTFERDPEPVETAQGLLAMRLGVRDDGGPFR
jgi:hypothetical protein